MLRRMVEKLCDRMNIQKRAGFPWSKGIPERNFPRPTTGGERVRSARPADNCDIGGPAVPLAFLIRRKEPNHGRIGSHRVPAEDNGP